MADIVFTLSLPFLGSPCLTTYKASHTRYYTSILSTLSIKVSLSLYYLSICAVTTVKERHVVVVDVVVGTSEPVVIVVTFLAYFVRV